jgi:hypothetical protein
LDDEKNLLLVETEKVVSAIDKIVMEKYAESEPHAGRTPTALYPCNTQPEVETDIV